MMRCGFCGVWVAVLVLAAGGAGRAAPPTTQEAERLLAQLSSEAVTDRERAAASLLELGPGIEATVRRFIDNNPPPEARMRADAVLRRIRMADPTRPTPVSVDVNSASVERVIESLAEQADIEFVQPYPDFWRHFKSEPITLNVQEEPFWKAMREVCIRSKLALDTFPHRAGSGLRLAQGSGSEMGGFASFNGPFMVLVTGAQYSRSLACPGQAREWLSLGMTFFAEPKARVLAWGNGIEWREITDDQGHSLIRSGNDFPAAWLGFFGVQTERGWDSFDRGQIKQEHGVGLQIPAPGTTKIARLRGEKWVRIQTRSQRIEFNDLLGGKPAEQRCGSFRFVVEEVKKQDRYIRVKMKIHADKPLDNSLWPNTAWLITASGRKIPMDMGGSYGRTLHDIGGGFSLEPGDDAGPIKMVWDVPVETRDLAIPIDFSNLPLP